MKTVKTRHHLHLAIFKGHLAWHWTLWAHSSPFDLYDLRRMSSASTPTAWTACALLLFGFPQVAQVRSRFLPCMAWDLWSLDTPATHPYTSIHMLHEIYSDRTRTEDNTVPSWHKPVAGKIIWTAIEHSFLLPYHWHNLDSQIQPVAA